MREIKFRAWDEVKKIMFFPSSISWKDGVLWVNDIHGENRLEYELVNPNASLMQFTGLKDKNGKEIYEGDIVDTEKGPHRVVWYHDGFLLKRDPRGSESETRESLFFSGQAGEVIGNIYENPELLK